MSTGQVMTEKVINIILQKEGIRHSAQMSVIYVYMQIINFKYVLYKKYL
jgi:hypothetical protein